MAATVPNANPSPLGTSPRWTMNTTDWTKIGKGALIAAGGALLTYLLDMLPNINFGDFTPLAVAGFSVLINAALKWMAGQKEIPPA